MDQEPYSPPPSAAPVPAPSSRRASVVAAGLVLALACGAGGYRLGRTSAAQTAPPITVAAPAAAPASAAHATPSAPPTVREFAAADLDAKPQAALVPLETTGKTDTDDLVLFRRGRVTILHDDQGGSTRTSASGGDPFDITVDGKPLRVYWQIDPADPTRAEVLVPVTGRRSPHVVDWGSSRTTWDGAKMSWALKSSAPPPPH